MHTLSATAEDIARWRREGRDDILRYAYILGDSADLWLDSTKPDKSELDRCPFVRKIPGSKKYNCRIYDTRPEVCREYQPWSGEPNDICEEIEE
jgi:Fe-S-cluster containining protein